MRYVAFLRGINVSGQKLIKMEMLKQHFEMPGFKNIVTYIQSGNVLFDAIVNDEGKLRTKIEKQLAKQLGYDVPTIVRSVDDVRAVIKNNPFGKTRLAEDQKVHVYFLSEIPSQPLDEAITRYKADGEEIILLNREIFLLTRSYGNSKLTNSLIEKKLGVTATARNWATVNKIVTL